jgi:hypothetical protein
LGGPAHEGFDIQERVRRKRKLGRALREDRRAKQSPNLGQIPANRSQRIVGTREQKLRQMLARRAPDTAQQHVRKQGPGLAPARRGQRLAVALDARSTEKMNGERHAALRRC